MSGNRGVVYLGPGKVEVQNIPYPKMQDPQGRQIDHGVILRVVSTNICGSDQHMVRGRTTAPEGLVLGHEITGEVVEIGRGVETMKIGDLVSVPFNVACGHCRTCKEHHSFDDRLAQRFFIRVEFRAGDGFDEASFRAGLAERVAPFGMRTELTAPGYRSQVAIMVSKADHCLNDLLYRQRIGQLPMDVVAVISNHPDLEPLARWHGIPYHHFALDPNDKPAQEARVWQVLEESGAELVILARYMQVLSPELCRRLDGWAINIHHSLLPGFKGAKPYHQAYQKGVKLVGATAHYINNDLDEGPIIAQGVETVDHAHYPEDLIGTWSRWRAGTAFPTTTRCRGPWRSGPRGSGRGRPSRRPGR